MAAAAAKAAEWEAKAKELDEKHDSIVKARSDKMKEALNKRLNDYKTQMDQERNQMQQDKEKLEGDFKLRMEQERKIWEAEQASTPSETKPPGTPLQQHKPETPIGTPTASTPDLSNLNDKDIRDLVSTNPTIKSIVQNNIKNKLAAETRKMREEQEAAMKTEWEQKINSARESATQLASSKMNLKLNMTENRARTANAKLEVVETAAKETPHRPVGEVWEIAKNAKPPPAAPKQPAPAPTPAAAPGATAAPTPTAQSIGTAQESRPTITSALPKPGLISNSAQLPNNPFANVQQGQAQQAPTAPNPFAQSAQPTPQQPAPTTLPQPMPPAAQSQIPMKVSNLPVPGGGRRASAPNQPRGGGRGGGLNRGGRGGGQQGRASLNASAENFQPGNKRPRGDSEAGNGPKRARGGGPQ
ncbi:hypothetical protein F5X99DRAFT_370877 [Biscogniauxia marginata]|nr:hypothetical protein F5X99DRAFT_370877 [Biscogniauxia marginata]